MPPQAARFWYNTRQTIDEGAPPRALGSSHSEGSGREEVFKNMAKIKEFHLFAGIGGGIYGGELLGNECCGGDRSGVRGV